MGSVGRGKSRHRPRNEPQLYGGEYPFIQTADIMKSEFYISTYSQTYSEMGLAQSKLWNENTLCITNAGANTGESAILSFKACFPDSVIGFVANPEISDVRYVKYYLDTIIYKIKMITRGATQDNLSMKKLLSFDIPTPPLLEQRKIAEVLSAFDLLIQSLMKRAILLDEITTSFFTEWFVKFRFPGNEKISDRESNIGMIPVGWKVEKLEKYVDFERGVEPGSKSYLLKQEPETVRFLRVGDISKRSTKIYIPEKLTKGKKISHDDILISLDGTVGLVKIGLEGSFSTGLRKCNIIDNIINKVFLYYTLKSENIQSTIKAHANGATILHAGSSIKDMKISLPPKYLLDLFEDKFYPLFENIITISNRIENLRKIKKILLPKLINGELDLTTIKMERFDDI
jgi:type I restriction enzyme, S subunit